MVLRALLNTYDFDPLDRPPQVSKSQLATVDKPTGPVYVSLRWKGESEGCLE